MEDLKKIYFQMLAVRDLPEETREYVEDEIEEMKIEREENEYTTYKIKN